LRCAATGETGVISPLGKIVARLPLQENGVLKTEVALLQGATVYSLIPWLAPALCIIGLVFQVSMAVLTRRARAQPDEPDAITSTGEKNIPAFPGVTASI
jgi:apolipoprotein N-acyltransferase